MGAKERGKKLKEAREKLGLTQAEVAKKVGLSTNFYARVERGEEDTSLRKLDKLEKILKIKIQID